MEAVGVNQENQHISVEAASNVTPEKPQESPREFLERHAEKREKVRFIDTLKKSRALKNIVAALVVAGRLNKAFNPDALSEAMDMSQHIQNILSQPGSRNELVVDETNTKSESGLKKYTGEDVKKKSLSASDGPPDNDTQFITVNGQTIAQM